MLLYNLSEIDNGLINLNSFYTKNITITDFDTIVNFGALNNNKVSVDATENVGQYTSLAIVNSNVWKYKNGFRKRKDIQV